MFSERKGAMKAVVLVSMLIFGSACAGAMRSIAGQHQDEKAPLARVNATEEGVCAYVDSSTSWNGHDYIKACARQGKNGDALLFTEFFCNTEDRRLDPTTWRVVVTRADGTVVLDRGLQPGQPYRGICMYGVCHTHTASADALPAGWATGHYQLRYTSAVDGKSFDASITLE